MEEAWKGVDCWPGVEESPAGQEERTQDGLSLILKHAAVPHEESLDSLTLGLVTVMVMMEVFGMSSQSYGS